MGVNFPGPRVVLAGDAPVLHLVSDLAETLAQLGARRLVRKAECSCRWARARLSKPGWPAACLCRLTGPDVDEHFIGRADF
jgi:hypothetical protein